MLGVLLLTLVLAFMLSLRAELLLRLEFAERHDEPCQNKTVARGKQRNAPSEILLVISVSFPQGSNTEDVDQFLHRRGALL